MDLTSEEIKQIQNMHDIIERKDFYLLFGVNKNASVDDIKKSYYSTSRQWHPDRFFRKDTGQYARMLEKIFIGINQAFRVLSNVEERSLFDKQYISKTPEEEQASSSNSFAQHRRRRSVPKKSAEERKVHTGNKESILERVKSQVDGAKKKAQMFFEQGKEHFDAGKPMEAAASLHVAYKLEPENEEYKTFYKKAREMAREKKALSIFSQAETAENYQNYQDAIRLYRQCLEYDIPDPRAYARLAYLIEKLEPDVRESLRLMRIAVQKDPKNPEYRCILAEIYAREGMERNARREFNEALQLQKGYSRAQEGLKNL